MDLWNVVQEHLNQVADRDLAREEKEWRELEGAINKLSPWFNAAMQGETMSNTAPDATELIPDKDLRRKVFNWYTEVVNRTPEKDEQVKAELEAAREEHARHQIKRDHWSISEAIQSLYNKLDTDGFEAAEGLVEVATQAALFLMLATRTHPEIMINVAAKTTLWPVIGREEAGWEKFAAGQISELGLGKGAPKFKSPLRKVRGSDVHLPARRWARAAVRTIDETRWKVPFFFHMVDKLGGSGEWATFSIHHGWDLAAYPSWVSSATKLEPLSEKTFDGWKVVVREIIREQVTDFHLLPEWATQRLTAEANARATPGEIQNAILDDIISALKRLVPEAEC
jgi:hypothetical protein